MNPYQTLADHVIRHSNNSHRPDPRSLEKKRFQVRPKIEKKQELSDSHERIPFKPLRYKFINLDYLAAREPRIKKEMGRRCNISADWKFLKMESKQILSKIHGAKAVPDLEFEFPKDKSAYDVISKDIANKLGQFSSLQKLRIRFDMGDGWRRFTKKTYEDIAQGLRRVPHLKDFHLKGEILEMDADGLKGLGKWMERLARLEKVTLEFQLYNSDAEKNLQDLCKSLKRHVFLKTVNLNWGKRAIGLTDEVIRYLGESMKKYTSVENFCLLSFGCKFGDLGLEYLNTGLKEMKNLKNMKFSFRGCDQITSVGMEKFLDGLEKHEKLERISLNFRGCDRIRGDGLQGLGERLKDFKALKSLTLKLRGLDKLTDQDLAGFSKCIEAKNDLEEIVLNFGGCNKLTDEGLKVLWEGLRGVSSLKKIELGLKRCNKITKSEIEKMVEEAEKAGINLRVRS